MIIKGESNGEITIRENHNINFENIFLPRKLKQSVVVVDLPYKVYVILESLDERYCRKFF